MVMLLKKQEYWFINVLGIVQCFFMDLGGWMDG